MTSDSSNSGRSAQLITNFTNGVLELRLDVPDRRNALSTPLLRQLVSELEVTEAEAVVIDGSGDCFCAGADLNEIEGSPRDNRFDEEVGAVVSTLRSTPAVVIAAIEGPCIGAGVELASACDLRIASSSAFFEVPAVRLGLLYNPVAVDGMVRRLGRLAVVRLLLIGERLEAKEALRVGAVDRVTGAGGARGVAVQLANETAAAGLREVRAGTKRLIDDVGRAGFDPSAWQALRDQLSASPVRRCAVKKAKQ